MKKTASLLLCIIMLFTLVSCGNDDEELFHSVEKEIVSGCYIEDLDDNMQSMYYYPDGDMTKERRYIVGEWQNIIKYASADNTTVAFHCIYGHSGAGDDKFVVFYLDEEKEIRFNTQDEFVEYCKTKNITLSDWKYGSGMGYDKTDLGNSWSVYDFPYPFTDKVMKKSEVVYEGYVSDIKQIENDKVEFIFAVPYGVDKEISSSNAELNVSEEVIGEYKFAMFGKDEVCYYEKLTLNTANGEVSVAD